MKWKVVFILLVGLGLIGLVLAGCGQTPEPCPECPACPDCPTAECAECPTLQAPPDCAACPETGSPDCPEAATGCPNLDQWASSAHADAEAAAFTYWDDEDPPLVPAECAKCHSEGGYRDFLGLDGATAGIMDGDHPVGTVVSCVACHNDAAEALDAVVFPSGAEISGLGPEARCMECHQGRASGQMVNQSILDAGLTDEDTTSEELGFTNIHYKAAAASMYGTLAQGGYQYEGKAYDAKSAHTPGFETCVQCHNSHTLQLRTEACSECHAASDPKDIRTMGSLMDYDGDGDVQEGIYYEMEGLQAMLYQAIQAYAQEVAATSIVYDANTYPYFFVDTNADGQADGDEAVYENKYNAWTGRLAKAAYNYQVSIKDPGAYAHGGKYIIQLLFDSIENLNEALSTPVDLSNAHRIDHRHFAGSEPAFRNWDEEGQVPGHCARCHTADGLPLYLAEGVDISQKPANGHNCATCHDDLVTSSIYEVEWVRFPRGALVTTGNASSNLCLNCHQGLSSIATVNGAIAGKELDTVIDGQEFIHIHFFAAGATLFGTEVQGAYEYGEAGYNGRFAHVEGYNSCTQCHDTHRQQVEVDACGACHPEVQSKEDLATIRVPDGVDYDGDGDGEEGIAAEIVTMRDALYAAIQTYAAEVAGQPIVYDPDTYPYFFADSNGNGQVDDGEAAASNQYDAWTPRLLRAAYNFQYSMNDPGAFAHNARYILQILYDSLADLGGDLEGMTRPRAGQ